MKQSIMLRKAQGLLLASGLFLLGSCAIGYDSPNGFDVGVSNTQMVTPDSFSYSIDKTGTTATVSWPLVLGAKYYEVSFYNVDDPENPVIVGDYDKKLVDGTSMKVAVAEDCNYRMEIRTIGNSELGNIDDPEPVVHSLTTLVQSVATIPSGSDIYEYLQTNPLDDLITTNKEVAIDLEAGGTYTCSGPVDFTSHKMTFRGNKINRATVKMVGAGALYTYSGLKIKFLNFDCAESTAQSLIFMSNSPSDKIKSQNLGKYYRDGKVISNIYMVEDPIYISSCWIKDLPNSIIHDNGKDVAFWNFTISDCIIQEKSNGKNPFINLQKKGRMIKEIEFKNSTIFNTLDGGSYWLRYNNQSNANPTKTFGNKTSEYSNSSVTLTNCTFSKTFSKGKMANNNRNSSTSTTVSRCVFYDIASIRQWLSYGTTKKYSFNFYYAVTSPDSSDPTTKDSGGAPFASTYDPQFLGDVTQSLDLTQPNGGVNFTPGEREIMVNTAGDPRWLESN